MNKSALKTFATNARRELLKKVEAKAMKIGITEDNIKKADIESSDAIFIDGRQLSKEERIQRDRLIDRINQIGFKRVMEEVAYTWFNRFTALRFMEVNDYLPTKVRVLSSTNADSTEPDMMKEALSLDLELDKEYIYDLKMSNNSEELFKYLIIKHCNDLNRYMPFMFEKIDDYTEILFPEGLLATDSFIRYMTNTELIPEDNWKEIEVIGWLYQFYIAEEKDQVFANLKKNIKITKDTLPAATQLFTPNWIVRYLVENSLGRIWLESYPDSNLGSEWRYYLDEAEQEEAVIKQLEEIRYKNVNPEEITFLDPCCGSGHILVYAFDVFYDMYIEKGYVENEIPQLILEKNLFGLDVDDRAAQLASFALMMKAREKSRRIFRKAIQPNILSIQESNWLTNEMISSVSGNDSSIMEILISIRDTFLDAKEYGTILKLDKIDCAPLNSRLEEYKDEQVDLVEMINKKVIEERLPLLIEQTSLLSRKYDVVCTNPPYMGQNGMDLELSNYVKKNFPDSKSDLYAVFIEICLHLSKKNGFISMINIPSWMFLGSFSKLREKIIANALFINLLHLGRGIFGADFGTTAFVIRDSILEGYVSSYKRLFESQSAVDSLEKKEKRFFTERIYKNKQQNYLLINGSPITYWAKEVDIKNFKDNKKLGELAEPKQGLATSDNNRFLRQWFEVQYGNIGFNYSNTINAKNSGLRWFPYNKGGAFRKWYGNNEYIVNWENDGYEIKNIRDAKGKIRSRPQNTQYYFKRSLTWSKVTIGGFSVRYIPNGFLFDVAGCSIFFENNTDDEFFYYLGLLNSGVSKHILSFLSPTVNYEVGHIASIPVKFSKSKEVSDLSKNCMEITKDDWDSYETSWDFQKHPFLKNKIKSLTLEDSFANWELYTRKRFDQLKTNERELNEFFINLYELEESVSAEVDDKNITINLADKEKDIKSFISYAIGCSFGRYSLDEEGLVYASGGFNPSRYKTFPADKDNILPILPGAYFEDDIVSRFVEFIRVTFGEDTLSENLEFVANALVRKKGETAKETIRRYFLNDFYKDHVQTYKKRPIYWLFSSGKEKAFNCLIYMHRYDKTTLSRIRTDYLHDYQIRLDAEKKDLLNIIEGDSTAKEISNAKKELKSLDKKIQELKEYDELLHHMADMQIEIDLDDGVKVNYEKFKGLVAKI